MSCMKCLFLYMLSLFCRTWNPCLFIPKFSRSSIFCLFFCETPVSSTRAAPCYPEISTRAKTASLYEIGPAAQTCEIPLLPLSRNAASTSCGQNWWAYARSLPHILDERVPKPWLPYLPLRPHSHRGRQNPRNPTLLHWPPDCRPAGDSSSTTSSTTTTRRPSSIALDEDPSSISLSRRVSRTVLHLQGAAPVFASSIAPPPSPQRHLDLPHRNDSTLTNSYDEAEAYSTKPRRFCTHRCILSFIRSHGAAGARYRAAMAGLHRWRRHWPLPPRRLSPMSLLPRWRLPHQH